MYPAFIFRKGKLAVWKTVTKNNAFVELFSSLGTEVTVSEELVRCLEWFVCSLYGYPRIQSVNEARRKVFWDRFYKENKIIDLSLMPPCSSNLRYHIMRANYVAYIFRHAGQLQMDLESPHDGHGWNADGNVVWSDICYPQEIDALLAATDIKNSSCSDDEEYENDLNVEVEDVSEF